MRSNFDEYRAKLTIALRGQSVSTLEALFKENHEYFLDAIHRPATFSYLQDDKKHTITCLPLYFSVFMKKEAIVRFLLESGVEVNRSIPHSRLSLPLHYAVQHRQTQMARLMLDYCNEVNLTDHVTGLTPLGIIYHKFGANTDAEMLLVLELLKRGAHANVCVGRVMYTSDYSNIRYWQELLTDIILSADEKEREELLRSIFDRKTELGYFLGLGFRDFPVSLKFGHYKKLYDEYEKFCVIAKELTEGEWSEIVIKEGEDGYVDQTPLPAGAEMEMSVRKGASMLEENEGVPHAAAAHSLTRGGLFARLKSALSSKGPSAPSPQPFGGSD